MNAFIRIRSMGASFAEVLPEIRTLWIMTIVYGAMACFGIHRILRREPCERGGEE